MGLQAKLRPARITAVGARCVTPVQQNRSGLSLKAVGKATEGLLPLISDLEQHRDPRKAIVCALEIKNVPHSLSLEQSTCRIDQAT